MTESNYSGSLGSRYGRKIRARFAEVEKKQRANQECPQCGKSVTRVGTGIYECAKCGKFTGSAYSI
jgi:ribosomal protein L37AE/L43A